MFAGASVHDGENSVCDIMIFAVLCLILLPSVTTLAWQITNIKLNV